MGTNYYVTHNYCEHCQRGDKLHIGKSSCGWKFALKINPSKYNSLGEFKQWLVGKNITNEYGDRISYEELMKKIKSKSKDKSHIGRLTDPLKVINKEEVDLVYYGFS